MASGTHHPDWNDDELVSLGDLRPSREYFGPLPKKEAKKKNSRKPAPQARREPSGSEAKRRPADQQRREPRPRPERAIDLRDQRSPQRRSEIQVRPERQSVPAQPSERGRRRPSPEGRNQRSDQQRPARPRVPDRDERRPKDSRKRRPVEIQAPTAAKAASGFRSLIAKPSKSEQLAREQMKTPIVDASIAVFSRKGGVGKTTVATYLGLTLAAERGGRVVAIDGDAEAGSLGWMLAPNAPSTLAELSHRNPMPSDWAGLRAYTTNSHGIEVVAGDTEGSEEIDYEGLERALVQIARNYDVSIYDTGGGVSVSASRVLVRSAGLLLVVMSTSVDSVRAAERTIGWLEERPGQIADPNVRIVAVVNGISSSTPEHEIAHIEEHFAPHVDAVARIPWDEALASGAAVGLENLNKATRKAFVGLAGTVVSVLADRDRAAVKKVRRVS